MPAQIKLMDHLRTGLDAVPTADTAPGEIGQKRFDALGFGIMTPAAMQGTPLKEDDGTDTGSIMGAEMLDVENAAGH